jgi:hypothetical protein
MREGRVGSVVVLLFLSVLIATTVVPIEAEEEYVLLASLQSPNQAGAEAFGAGICLGEDILIITDPYADVDDVSRVGMLYIYDRSWNLVESVYPPTLEEAQYFGGFEAEVYGDLFVTSGRGPHDDEGQTFGEVYVYDLEGVLQFSLVSPVLESNLSSTMKRTTAFGVAVSLREEVILVGEPLGYVGMSFAGLVHVYDFDGSLLTSLESPQPIPDGCFGQAIESSDEFILVRETGFDRPLAEGSVYVFDYDWNLVTTLHSPDGQEYSHFGYSIAISGDHIVVGERWASVDGLEKTGRAHIYDTDWNLIASLQAEEPEANGQFGEHVAIGGGLVVVGERRGDVEVINEGRAYVYDLEGNLLASLNAPEPEVGAQFGWRVETDGEIVVVGEVEASVDGISKKGKAYVYGLGEPAVVEPVVEEPVVEEDAEETQSGGGIPGFPYESIVIGILVVIVFWSLQKRR